MGFGLSHSFWLIRIYSSLKLSIGIDHGQLSCHYFQWVLLSAYFVCDTIDMLQHEVSRWTIELLLHHVASLFVFGCSVLPCKFLPYAYGALLMEVNSIFLHIRSLMQITGMSKTDEKAFSVVCFVNITTFLIFRFAVQIWQISWAWIYRHNIHLFYVLVGTVGGSFFLVINIILFIRVLASDGLLGEFGRKHAAINRDKQGNGCIMKALKKH